MTATTNRQGTLPTVGGDNNTWGDGNNALHNLWDTILGSKTPVSTTGGTTALATADENVVAINVTGTLTSAAIITFSGRGGSWIVRNATTGAFTLTCKVSGQTGVTVTQSQSAVVWCNGTDILLAGYTDTKRPGVVSLTDGATVAVNAAQGDTFDLIAGGNRTISAPTLPADGKEILFRIYGSGGARTVSLASGTGGFSFGTDVTAVPAVASGKWLHVKCKYSLTADRWHVLATSNGY